MSINQAMRSYEIKEALGIIGGVGTTFSFLPQVYRVITDKRSIDGLSPYMLSVHFAGVSCWVAYGILDNDAIITAFNIITVLLLSAIIVRYIGVKLLNNPGI